MIQKRHDLLREHSPRHRFRYHIPVFTSANVLDQQRDCCFHQQICYHEYPRLIIVLFISVGSGSIASQTDEDGNETRAVRRALDKSECTQGARYRHDACDC